MSLIPKPSLIPLQMPRVVACMEWLDKELQPTGEVHTIQTLIARLDILCAALPFINTQMASAQQALRSAKVATYRNGIGERVQIVSFDTSHSGDSYPFKSAGGDIYRNGGEYISSSSTSDYDLIELISLPTPTYTIAPLEWVSTDRKPYNPAKWEVTVCKVRFKIVQYTARCWTVTQPKEIRDVFRSLDEAKAYCQAHHEAQVKKLLLPA